jgi:hypothetical protein
MHPTRLVLLLIVGILSCSCCGDGARAQSTEPVSAPPHNRQSEGDGAAKDAPIAFIATKKGDLGEISLGNKATFEFVVENRGKSALEIATKAACGCTLVQHDKVIAPGERGTIKAELHSSTLRGEFSKAIAVETNDPANSKFELILTGRVVQYVTVDPIATLGLHPAESTQLEFSVRTKEQVAVTGVSCASPYVQATLKPQGERAYRVGVTVSKEAPTGRSEFQLVLATTVASQPEIPIRVNCEKGIIVFPSSFRFGITRLGQPVTPSSMVLLRNRDGEFEIRSASSSDPNLKVEIEKLKSPGIYRLKTTYAGDLAGLDEAAVVQVETNNPHQPKLVIPIAKSSQNSSKSIGVKPQTKVETKPEEQSPASIEK